MEGECVFLPASQEEKQKEIFILLDISYSMCDQEEELAKGVNDVLDTLLFKQKDECLIQVSIDTFNQTTESLMDSFMLTSDYPRLSASQFKMDGDTALYDAIGKNLDALPILTTPLSNVVLVVGTDGKDTASKIYGAEQVRRLVDQYKKKGVSFVYIAAGEDAYQTGVNLGFTQGDVADTDQGVGSSLSSQIVREAISQALGFAEGEPQPPSEFDPSPTKKIKYEDDICSQYY